MLHQALTSHQDKVTASIVAIFHRDEAEAGAEFDRRLWTIVIIKLAMKQ